MQLQSSENLDKDLQHEDFNIVEATLHFFGNNADLGTEIAIGSFALELFGKGLNWKEQKVKSLIIVTSGQKCDTCSLASLGLHFHCWVWLPFTRKDLRVHFLDTNE